MKRLGTLGTLALFVVPTVGCGNSSVTQGSRPSSLVRFSLPQQVVAQPSTDPAYAIEASIPMVVSESAGVAAYIVQMGVKTTDEATGVTSYPVVVRDKSVQKIPARGSVEIPLRVYLSSAGTYRAKVVLDAWDETTPGTVSTGSEGAFQLWSNAPAGERSYFESDEFRIVPPQ